MKDGVYKWDIRIREQEQINILQEKDKNSLRMCSQICSEIQKLF